MRATLAQKLAPEGHFTCIFTGFACVQVKSTLLYGKLLGIEEKRRKRRKAEDVAHKKAIFEGGFGSQSWLQRPILPAFLQGFMVLQALTPEGM